MNESINTPEKTPEFSPGYLRWLYTLTCIILLVVFFFQPAMKQQRFGRDSVLMPAYIIAAGQIVSYGIDEFQRPTIEPIEDSLRWTALASMLLSLILAPTFVILLSVKHSASEGKEHAGTSIVKGISTFLYITGLAYCAIVFFSTVSGSYISPQIHETMKYDNAVSEERDMLINDLVSAYSSVIQYYYQMEKFGGKNKNIVSHSGKIKVISGRTLADFGIEQKTKFGTLHLEPIASDTMIVIHAVGTIALKDNSYNNINNEAGRVQESVRIYPSTLKYFIERKN